MILFSPIDSTICTVKNWYVIMREAFTIRNKAATMNDVASDKSCLAIDENGDVAFKNIFFKTIQNYVYIFWSDME